MSTCATKLLLLKKIELWLLLPRCKREWRNCLTQEFGGVSSLRGSKRALGYGFFVLFFCFFLEAAFLASTAFLTKFIHHYIVL